MKKLNDYALVTLFLADVGRGVAEITEDDREVLASYGWDAKAIDFEIGREAALKAVDQIVVVGSIDGILTGAALLRFIGRPEEVGLVFTQAGTVDRLDPSEWAAKRRVAFVDLAVNNRDKAMTANFVRRLREAGHELVAVCDEHDSQAWREIVEIDGLLIKPQSQAQGQYKSSGAVLMAYAGHLLDAYGQALCASADRADAMVFEGLGATVNAAVKSKMHDDARRVYLARHFAQSDVPDQTIQGWIEEYEAILSNHQEILATKLDLGDGIVRVSALGKAVDMTALMGELYKIARVVVVEVDRSVSFGTSDREFDILASVKKVVPSASGFAGKANIEPEFEGVALKAVRAALKG